MFCPDLKLCAWTFWIIFPSFFAILSGWLLMQQNSCLLKTNIICKKINKIISFGMRLNKYNTLVMSKFVII